MSGQALHDQHHRHRAATQVHRGMVMSAGAGAGKTHTLIDRLAAVLAADPDQPRRIVAITFTDRAARDLTHRLRKRLPSVVEAGDAVFVGTIHSFCLSLLRRFPLEAGLPPVFSAQGELMNGADAAERIRRISRHFFEMVQDRNDPQLRDALDVVFAVGADFHLDQLIALIDREWDRFRVTGPSPVGSWRAALAGLDELFEIAEDPLVKPSTREAVGGSLGLVRAIQSAGSMLEAVRLFPDKPAFGNTRETRGPSYCKAILNDARHQVLGTALGTVLAALTPVVIDEALRRCREGVISFDDILVLTRDLLNRHPEVTVQLRSEIGHLCVDEFQDTDPVQYEIVQRLTEPRDGHAQPVLFAVGDPKQSIYGFRRADVELFEELGRRPDLDHGLLSVNFRSRPRVLEWVNHTFGGWFQVPGQVSFADLVAHVADGDSSVCMVADHAFASAAEAQQGQADAIAQAILAICATKIVRQPNSPPGQTPVERPARFDDIAILVRRRGDLSTLEPTLTAAGIPYSIEGGVLLYDAREVTELLRVLRAVNDPGNEHAVVVALRTTVLACSDADLLRHRTVAGATWNPTPPAAEQVGDPVVLAAFSELRRWSRVRHIVPVPELLLALARDTFSWAASTSDAATTRASWRRLRAVIDEARYWFEQTGGSLTDYLEWVDVRIANDDRSNITTDEPDEGAVRILTVHAAKGLDFPVVIVAGLGGQRPAPSSVRAQFHGGHVHVKCGKDLATAGYDKELDPDPALEAARLAYVACTRARDHLVVSLAHKQGSTKNSAVEMRAHAADGDALALRSLPHVEPPPIAELIDTSQQTAAPRRPPWAIRSSVAATQVARADDPAGPAVQPWWTPGTSPEDVTIGDDAGLHPAIETDDPVDQDDTWDGTPDSAGGFGVRWSVPAEGAESLHSKPPRSRQALPEQVGRYGTIVGRAVHGVIQRVSLDDPAGHLADLVRLQCAAEAVPEHLHHYVGALVQSILASDAFARLQAASRRGTVRREMYVGAQHHGQGIYGIIDAIWREDGRFVVVDFKTDHARQSNQALAATYTPQLQAYATALVSATGVQVGELLLCVAVADGSPAVTVPIPLPSSTPAAVPAAPG